MEYVHLGRTGVKVSRLCLGTMNFGPETSEADSFAIMDRALELGINFFDTADVSTRRTSMDGKSAKVGLSRSWGVGSLRVQDGVKKSCWQQRCSAGWAIGRISLAYRLCTSNELARRACGVCRPTASISIRCIILIGRRHGRKSGRRWSN